VSATTGDPQESVGSLLLLRHGESEWNAANRFTGWVDVDLTERGRAESCRAGELLRDEAVVPDLVHTSVLRRATSTAADALAACHRDWVPVRRSWRLNERHYGDLQGRNKAEIRAQYGEEQFMRWRRSYDVPPPPIADDSEFSQSADDRYASLSPELIPRTECLKDVVDRLLPYWHDAIVPDLRTGATVLVVAHGNSLRALVKHLDDVAEDEIVGVNIPTGVPLLYDLDPRLRPTTPGGRYLDPAAAAVAIDAVKQQGH
jgi:2,3-bisphosphoglycerate-dependent phosphoglycerate mutase